MSEFKERRHSISVPANTGVDGFLRTLRSILTLPRVQSISIDAKGNVQYTRYVRDGEPDQAVGVDYAGLDPWSIIRNGQIEEIAHSGQMPATSVIAYMFNMIMGESLVPIAFAMGASSYFWNWHKRTSGVGLSTVGSIYGLPVYTDRNIPDDRFILCAAYTRGSTLPECHRFLLCNMFIENTLEAPETRVNVL